VIEFNIGYGKEGATEEEIRKAAEAARLSERIEGFPDGEAASLVDLCFFRCTDPYTFATRV
jgi:ABC-type multidrug transport system fused ATPase/permease subunit